VIAAKVPNSRAVLVRSLVTAFLLLVRNVDLLTTITTDRIWSP